jgi:hypothetical protein
MAGDDALAETTGLAPDLDRLGRSVAVFKCRDVEQSLLLCARAAAPVDLGRCHRADYQAFATVGEVPNHYGHGEEGT